MDTSLAWRLASLALALTLALAVTLAAQLALALAFSKLATLSGAKGPARAVAFAFALLATGLLATRQGLAQRAADRDARAALARAERPTGRVVLVERPGCPYCEALLLDLLARREVLARLAKTGLARREAAPGEPAPILLARDASGREVARET